MPVNDDRLEEFFWKRVKKSNGDGCWEWTVRGGAKRNGYGNIVLFDKARGFKNIGAHRASWMIHFGPIPKGLVVRHKCDNRACVRPEHLELGTQSENIRDAFARGRMVSGFVLWKKPPTHCPKGHPYDVDNTMWQCDRKGRSSRKCRVCDRERNRVSYKIARQINVRAKQITRELNAILLANPQQIANAFQKVAEKMR